MKCYCYLINAPSLHLTRCVTAQTEPSRDNIVEPQSKHTYYNSLVIKLNSDRKIVLSLESFIELDQTKKRKNLFYEICIEVPKLIPKRNLEKVSIVHIKYNHVFRDGKLERSCFKSAAK